MKVILSFVTSIMLLFLLACNGSDNNGNGESVNNDSHVEENGEENGNEGDTDGNDEDVDEQDNDHSGNDDTTLSDDEQIIEVVEANLFAANIEDIDGYMATIHPDSPSYGPTEQSMLEIFDIYDLDYSLDELEVVEVSGDTGVVRFIQTTVKISGPEFNDNQVEGTHTLRKHDGEWKIFGTHATNTIYLNDNGDSTNGEVVGDSIADFFAMITPLLDEVNGNVPGQSIPNDTYEFINEHPDLFPATERSIDKGLEMLDVDVNYQQMAKSLSSYQSTLVFDGGYIIEIFEDYLIEIDGYLTELLVATDNGEVYQILYPDALEEVYYDDYVEFMGLPTVRSNFPNVSGGYTNVIVIIASHVE